MTKIISILLIVTFLYQNVGLCISERDSIKSTLRPNHGLSDDKKDVTVIRFKTVYEKENEIRQMIENYPNRGELVSVLITTQGEGLGMMVETMISLSANPDVEPCGIDHSLTNAIANACMEKPELMDIFAEKIKYFLETRENELLLQVAMVEIITTLIEVSFKKKDEQNFAQNFTTPQLMGLLKRAFWLYHSRFERNFEYPDETSFTGNDIILTTDIVLKAIDKNWYFIEQDNRFIGIVEMYHNTGSSNLSLFIHIFEQEYARVNIGSKIMNWAAQYVGVGSTITFLYPVDGIYMSFFWKCKERGIFVDVEVMNSTEDNFMNIRALDYNWQRIDSLENATALRRRGQNLFVRGKVSCDVKDNGNRRLTKATYRAFRFDTITHKHHFDRELALISENDMERVKLTAGIIFGHLSPAVKDCNDRIKNFLDSNNFAEIIDELQKLDGIFSGQIDKELKEKLRMGGKNDAVYLLNLYIKSEVRNNITGIIGIIKDIEDNNYTKVEIKERLQRFSVLLEWIDRLSKGLPTLPDSYTAYNEIDWDTMREAL